MQKKQNIEFIVQAGLGVILIILFLLGIYGMYQIREANQDMSNLVHINQLKVKLAHEMRDSIRLREIGLNKMLAIEDPFERDAELMQFYDHAGIYRRARARLKEMPMDAKEKQIHDELTQVIRIAQPLNRKAAELIYTDRTPEEIMAAVKAASREQKLLLKFLDDLVKLQHDRAHDTVITGAKKYDRSMYLVLMFGAIIILGALIIVRIVSKFAANRSQELVASEAALSANKTKSAFLATMSHEIRTPLTAIIGFAEMLLDSEHTKEDRISAIKTIIRSGKHLLQIINDILDLSKIEADKLELEMLEISPFELLSDIDAIVKPLADAKEITFKIEYEFPIPKFIVSDPLRLKQIIINLACNAIKFTNTGHVLINVEYNREIKRITFNVIDSGIGMTDKQLENIFDAFTQADSTITREYGGTGLGLSLSKKLARQLNGDIEVKSLKNIGSQFKLEINLDNNNFEHINNENEIPISQQQDEYSALTEKYTGNVLLAEDDNINQLLLTKIIEKLGVTLDLADNGKVALDMAAVNDYDLIFMDMQMPVLSGLDAVKQLRKDGYQKPVVALTANAMQKDKEASRIAGCDDFLTKPIDQNELHRVAALYLHKDIFSKDTDAAITSTLLENEPDLVDLVEMYCAQLPGIIGNIKQLHKNSNWPELKNEFHILKGNGGGYGFPILTELASKIEFQLANKDYKAVERLILDLDGVICRIIKPMSFDNKPASSMIA